MFAFLRESDEAVLRVQSISAASVQKENHAHLSEGSNSTVGSLQTSFTLFEIALKGGFVIFGEAISHITISSVPPLKAGGESMQPRFYFHQVRYTTVRKQTTFQ